MLLILNIIVCMTGAILGICVFTEPVACYWSGAITAALSLAIWEYSNG
jgi:hypothetical protein